jgi:hypothetical protein
MSAAICILPQQIMYIENFGRQCCSFFAKSRGDLVDGSLTTLINGGL